MRLPRARGDAMKKDDFVFFFLSFFFSVCSGLLSHSAISKFENECSVAAPRFNELLLLENLQQKRRRNETQKKTRRISLFLYLSLHLSLSYSNFRNASTPCPTIPDAATTSSAAP